MQASLVGGELVGYFLRSLDDPEVEVFSLYDEVIAIANLLLNLSNLLAGESRHDTVYEGSVNATALVEPLLEVCGQLPQFDVLIDAILQHVTVQENKLTGEDDESLRGVTVESLPAAVQQLHQLTGIRTGGFVLQLAGGVKSDTCFGGVRNHEANLRLVSQSHEGIILGVGVQCAADNVDALQGVHGLTVLAALQVDVVQAVLTVQPLYHTLVDRLYDNDTTIEVGLLVHVPDNPIYECTEEVSLTKLNHLFRHHALRSEVFV